MLCTWCVFAIHSATAPRIAVTVRPGSGSVNIIAESFLTSSLANSLAGMLSCIGTHTKVIWLCLATILSFSRQSQANFKVIWWNTDVFSSASLSDRIWIRYRIWISWPLMYGGILPYMFFVIHGFTIYSSMPYSVSTLQAARVFDKCQPPNKY